MKLRERVANAAAMAKPALALVAAVAATAAIVWFLPARTAAALLGLIAAGLIYVYALRPAARETQIATLWFSLAICADAAFAKLNDLTPVTLASAVARLCDAIVKLGEGVVRSFAPVPADARVKIAAVTPDFVWAAIVGLVLCLAFLPSAARRR